MDWTSRFHGTEIGTRSRTHTAWTQRLLPPTQMPLYNRTSQFSVAGGATLKRAAPRQPPAASQWSGHPGGVLAPVIQLASWRQCRISAGVEKHVRRAVRHNISSRNDKRVIIEGKCEMSGMKKAADTSLTRSTQELRREAALPLHKKGHRRFFT